MTCKCTEPGFCNTHQREMCAVRFAQCKHEPGYFEVFQKSFQKDGKNAGRVKGLGDLVHGVMKATGVDYAVKKVLGKKCGCGQRQEWLNEKVPFTRKPSPNQDQPSSD